MSNKSRSQVNMNTIDRTISCIPEHIQVLLLYYNTCTVLCSAVDTQRQAGVHTLFSLISVLKCLDRTIIYSGLVWPAASYKREEWHTTKHTTSFPFFVLSVHCSVCSNHSIRFAPFIRASRLVSSSAYGWAVVKHSFGSESRSRRVDKNDTQRRNPNNDNYS